MKRMLALALAALLLLGSASAEGLADFLSGLLGGSREWVVGTDIAHGDIREFYYTYDASTYPPFYQRYRFYLQDGIGQLYHETREGGGWPQEERDITASGTVALTDEQWERFCACLDGGAVRARQEHLESGDAGPWLYLYWSGDKGVVQEFSFPSREALGAFEALCVELSDPG